jgi:hypothetical protein
MAVPVRVMLEQGKKKRVVACAFDWPGWDRSARIGQDVLAVLAAYRPRYGKVADRAGFGKEFGATGDFKVSTRTKVAADGVTKTGVRPRRRPASRMRGNEPGSGQRRRP